jgi:hypothetical protein
MNYHIIPAGSTSEIVLLEIRANNNNPATGLAFNTAGLVCRYTRPGEVPVAITLANQTVTGAYVSGGFKEIDSVNSPGLYRFDVPDAAIASGKDSVMVSFHGFSASSTAYYMFQLGNIVAQAQIATPVYSLKSDQATCDEKLDVFVGSALTVNLQTVDANSAPVAISNRTCTVRVYDLANNLVASYTPAIQYDSNGELSFNLTSAVTATAGTYNIYVNRVGVSDVVNFGPLQLKVKPL